MITTEILSTMTRSTGKEFIFNGSFHEAFSPILILAQCLAMLPVIGVKRGSAYGLRFTWKSFRTIYSVTAFCFAASYTLFATCITLTKPITFKSIGWYWKYSNFIKQKLNQQTFLMTLYTLHSSSSIFHDNRFRRIKFHSFGEKMAQTDATLGICRGNFTSIQNLCGKKETSPRHSQDIDDCVVCCPR